MPTIDPSCFVAEGAIVRGDVTLERGASVWFNAVLRGDCDRIVVGEGSNIQDGCVVHVDFGKPVCIGRNVTVGHGAIVHGCTIGDGALIGMGAIVMNGADVGEGAVIGAGAVVTEGKAVPPRTLAMGVPARVVRELAEEEVDRLCTQAADLYVERSKQMEAAGILVSGDRYRMA